MMSVESATMSSISQIVGSEKLVVLSGEAMKALRTKCQTKKQQDWHRKQQRDASLVSSTDFGVLKRKRITKGKRVVSQDVQEEHQETASVPSTGATDSQSSSIGKHTIQIQNQQRESNGPIMTLDDQLCGYRTQIIEYMHSIESRELNFNEKQNFIYREKDTIRPQIMVYMFRVQEKLKLSIDTLFLAAYIAHKASQSRKFWREQYDLVTIASLFIAAKYEEIRCPPLSHFVGLSRYNKLNILFVESRILLGLDFNLSYVSPLHFLGCMTKHPQNRSLRELASSILHFALTDSQFYSFRASDLAESALKIAQQIHHRQPIFTHNETSKWLMGLFQTTK